MPLTEFSPYKRDIAFPGQVNSIGDYRHIAGTNEGYRNGTGDYIPFGSALVRDDTDASLMLLPSATGQTVIGFSIYNDKWTAKSDNPRVTGIPPLELLPVLKKGVIFLLTETNLSAGDTLFFRHTVSATPTAFTQAPGVAVRGDADGGTADAFAVGTYRVVNAAVAGEVAEVRFDLSPVA